MCLPAKPEKDSIDLIRRFLLCIYQTGSIGSGTPILSRLRMEVPKHGCGHALAKEQRNHALEDDNFPETVSSAFMNISSRCDSGKETE